jgi:hypothetical protein
LDERKHLRKVRSGLEEDLSLVESLSNELVLVYRGEKKSKERIRIERVWSTGIVEVVRRAVVELEDGLLEVSNTSVDELGRLGRGT